MTQVEHTDRPSEMIPLEEIAARLDLNVASVRRMAKRGDLPGLLPRIGKHHRVSRAAFERWMNGESAA